MLFRNHAQKRLKEVKDSKTMERRAATFLSGGEGVEDARGLLLVHLNVLVYSLCFWIVQPVLPFLSKELGADAVSFGQMQSVMSVLSLLGGTFLGRLTDIRGAKLTIMISHLGGVIMYSLMGFATDMNLLFLSRTPAFLQHAMLCAQAAISGIAPVEHRSAAMGRLSVSYAIGMVLGSPLGGEMAAFIGFWNVARVSAGISTAILVFDAFFLPEFVPGAENESKKGDGETDGSLWSQIKTFFSITYERKVSRLLLLIFPVSVGIGAFRSMFALIGPENFDLEPADLGKFISFAAFVGFLTNVFVLKPFVESVGEGNAISIATCSLMVLYIAYGHISSSAGLIAVTIPSTMASTVLYTLSSSLMSLAVAEGHVGTAISLSHASRSLVGIVAPIVGGVIYKDYHFKGLTLFTSASAFLSFFFSVTFARAILNEIVTSKSKQVPTKEKTS